MAIAWRFALVMTALALAWQGADGFQGNSLGVGIRKIQARSTRSFACKQLLKCKQHTHGNTKECRESEPATLAPVSSSTAAGASVSKSKWPSNKLLAVATFLSLSLGSTQSARANDAAATKPAGSATTQKISAAVSSSGDPSDKAIVVTGGFAGAVGVFLLRSRTTSSKAQQKPKVAAEKPAAEDAAAVLAGMKPSLAKWEKAQVDVDEAKAALEEQDPATTSTGLTSLFYQIDPFNQRKEALLPLQAKLNATEDALAAALAKVDAYIAAVKTEEVRKQCEAAKGEVQQRQAARQAERQAAEARKVAEEEERVARERAEREAKERAEILTRKQAAEKRRVEEEASASREAQERVRRDVMAKLQSRAEDIVNKNRQQGTMTLKLDALLAAKQAEAQTSTSKTGTRDGAEASPGPSPATSRIGTGRIGVRGVDGSQTL